MRTRADILTLVSVLVALVGCGGSDNEDIMGGASTCPAFAEEMPPEPRVEQVASVIVETLAGSSSQGKSDGVGTAATFYNPVSMVMEPNGDLIVADFDNSLLRRVTPAGGVVTLADPGNAFTRPFGLTWLGGALYVETDQNTDGSYDRDAGSIWTVDPVTGDARLITEGIGRPRGLAPWGDQLLMADIFHHEVRLLDPKSDEIMPFAGQWDCPGFVDGMGEEARFEMPYGIAVDLNGDYVIADRGNHAIRRIQKNGRVTTIAGNGSPGAVDGALAEARFNEPIDVAVDGQGRIYVSDLGNNRIRRIDEGAGQVVTIAGSGQRGFADGSGDEAQFYGLEGLDVTADGKTIYVTDGTRGEPGKKFHRLRVVTIP